MFLLIFILLMRIIYESPQRTDPDYYGIAMEQTDIHRVFHSKKCHICKNLNILFDKYPPPLKCD